MADSIESQKHFMRALDHLETARRELAIASAREPNTRSWDYVYAPIDRAVLNIVKRDRTWNT